MALTPEQIDGLKETFGKIAQPINEWLLQDAARRIRQAAEYAGETGGKMTRTAAYELWRAKAMGESEREMKAFMRRQLGLSNKEIRRLFRQAARFSRDNDEERVGLTGGADIAQMTAAAIQLAQKDFTNLTQTLGMMTPGGKVQPLRRFYQETMDFAFEQVFTGAADYQTALRQATTKMADAGVRTIDYASGRSISIEAAVRRNLMGGMGLLDEQITKANHDALGCNGWEITAHRNSAPDHEPYQGKQFSDAEWAKLNGTPEKPGILKRRIETLNCNHHAMPIILGVNAPQYTDAELAAMREENAKGITYEGRHYTGYEATQKQRQIERNMRTQKNRILVSEQLEDKTKKQTAQIRLQILRGHYKAFSKAAGLPLQEERAWVAGFGPKQAKEASVAANTHHKAWLKSIGTENSELNTIEKYAEGKYNNSPEFELLKQYTKDVDSGWISPLCGFDNYKELHERIESGIVGKTASNGTVITGQVPHFMQRVVGTSIDPEKLRKNLRIIRRSGVKIEDIENALFNPISIGQRIIKENGKPSVRFIGAKCNVSINPDTGMLIQTNPRKE